MEHWNEELRIASTVYYKLTRLFPMHPFSTPLEHQKAVGLSDIFGR